VRRQPRDRYALAIAIGSPLLIVAVGRFDTRWALVGLMGLFSVGNLIVGLSPAFGGLLVGRIASGAAHGAVVAIGASVAASLVRGRTRRSRVATVLLGLTAAMVLGVPVGNALGAAIGWRGTFLVVAGVGLVGLLACSPGSHRCPQKIMSPVFGPNWMRYETVRFC